IHIVKVSSEMQAEQIERLERFRGTRDSAAVTEAIDALKRAASDGTNIMPPSIEAAKAGVTTGEWADALRDVFGTYRAPTGVSAHASAGSDASRLAAARERVGAIASEL